MFYWASRDRLCPMRITWIVDDGIYANFNEPKYVLRRERRRGLRKAPKLSDEKPMSKIEWHRFQHQSAAGKLGEWPVFKWGRRKRT